MAKQSKNNNKLNMNMPRPSMMWIWGLIGAFIIGWYVFGDVNDTPVSSDWTTVQQMVEKGDVEKIQIVNRDQAQVFLRKEAAEQYRRDSVDKRFRRMPETGVQLIFTIGSVDSFREDLKAAEQQSGQTVPVVYENKENGWTNVLINLLPWVLIIGVWIFVMRSMSRGAGGGAGGGIMNVGKAKAQVFDKDNTKRVTFKDVAGLEEAKVEIMEIVDFLKKSDKYRELGAKIPKGALLVGPPGTGKTLLAKAVAGEANVPFLSISGSDFVEMFVGVGASRVRDLFVQGKKNAPCLIFIDEIDAVGRQRGAGLGGGHDEREQTLNQLLVEMDGFESNEGVILIAATNRPDVLDPALLRPGRFDRQVVVPTPDVKGRLKILEVHTRRTPLDKHVNLEVIARGTPGFSGAALENLVNEAALQAARLGQDTVFMRDFEYAKDKVLMGKERRSLILSDEEKRITAYHEGGHALVAKLLPGTDPVHKVTIIPRGRALGVTMQLPEGDRHGYSKAFLQNNLMVLLAGRVAEEIIFDTITTGAGNDIERATGMARKMVCEWGMSDVVGPMTIGEQGEEVFIGRDWGHARNYSEDTARIVDAEIKKLVETARENCHKLLQENINLLHALAKALLDRETITGDDIDLLVKGEPLPPFDADGSAAKQEPAAPAPASADAEGETFKLEAEPSQDGGTGEKTQDETKQQ